MPTTLNRLYPSFVAIDYTSQWGQHRQTIPTLQWNGSGLGDPGTFDTHDSVGIVSTVMIDALIAVYRPILPEEITLVSYTIYNLPTMTSIPQPVYGEAIGLAGTDSTTIGQARATQWTLSIRTTAFGLFKFTVLDRANGNVWGNVTTMDSVTEDLFDEICSAGNGWSGRGGGRPLSFMGISVSLNKRLRRKYDMV